jgi:pectinesterase
MKRGLVTLLCLCLISRCFGQTANIIVAANGSGNYRTVQEAINAAPDNSDKTTVIFIKKGIYKEKLYVPLTKRNLKIIGEDRDSTILTYDDYHARKDSSGREIGTAGSATVHIYGEGFSAENITFQNSAGPVGQAVAVLVGGNRSFFKNCRFLGFQDTLYTHGHGLQMYADCYIEGTIDFIFGSATAWFQNCTIYCKGNGYVTAASTDEKAKYGYVFKDCIITGDTMLQSHYLGRPWKPYAKVVYITCQLGQQIKPEGWDFWGNVNNKSTAYYAEYKNSGAGFTPGQRVTWAHQLTDDEAQNYTSANVLAGWDPQGGK